MGRHFDAKVLQWKSSIEDTTKNSLQFLNEVIEKQKPVLEDDSMDLESEFDMREEIVKKYQSYHPNVYNKVVDSLTVNEENEHNIALCSTQQKIVGDNVDMEIAARIERKERGNKSLHWTHQFAVLDRASPVGDNRKQPRSDMTQLRVITT
ncbi:Hypothetical predicted protein [Paramuricea clavata]|uniref:Uncharacterized protein n=1 Tax=Paramuricea clavata TaxID=317549 RepID=A0A6S7KNE6_PARCT|nr:Hypothetical predicted protein [Paramuricea clavata]